MMPGPREHADAPDLIVDDSWLLEDALELVISSGLEFLRDFGCRGVPFSILQENRHHTAYSTYGFRMCAKYATFVWSMMLDA